MLYLESAQGVAGDTGVSRDGASIQLIATPLHDFVMHAVPAKIIILSDSMLGP
jgi:hypothetical protein